MFAEESSEDIGPFVFKFLTSWTSNSNFQGPLNPNPESMNAEALNLASPKSESETCRNVWLKQATWTPQVRMLAATACLSHIR